MGDHRPGLNPRRLARLIDEAVDRCRLDLSGLVVLTEAATGSYAVTPVLAAKAGADQVFALARSSVHGSVEAVCADTRALADLLGVERAIEIITTKTAVVVGAADIVTNSGHVRPIDTETVAWMKPSAVVPLMYEAWEFRETDVDLGAC